MSVEIALQNPRRFSSLEPGGLLEWLREVLDELAPKANSFGVRFVDDAEMQRLNHRFRGRDRTTDVLSFPGGESGEGYHLGDVVIAVPTARRQAAADGRPERREIRTLLLHGVLHCLGLDHEVDDGEMERLEARLRQRWVANVD
jgi:probable rRNA maturation factor